MINSIDIRKGLRCKRFGITVYSFESIDSTNTCARSLADCDSPEGTLVIAEVQTAGKGRLGRTWIADPGQNLTFSLILRPGCSPAQINLLPLGIAVAVAEGVHATTGLKPFCKWPNDLMLGGKKCAGILMESALGGNGVEYVILGVGINVNQRVFSPGLQNRATSLALQTGNEVDRLAVLRAVLESLEQNYEMYSVSGFDKILPAWLERAPMIGAQITADMQGTIITGTVTGVSSEGGLQLHTDAGDHTLFAGDITIVNMESYAPRN
jgi:BirA family biotin operon repressor/biotin-[acetyl-CoA-carboxylase] ligase